VKWITITPTGSSKSGQTKVWEVRAKQGGAVLGRVRWYAGWRKYVFAPEYGSEYEQDCLRDIAAFVEQATREHWETRHAQIAAEKGW
jgi:hypothetical protein